LAGKKKASLEKILADDSQLLALAKKRAGGKTPTHDDLEAVQADLQKQVDALDEQMGGSTDKADASNTPKKGDVIKGYTFKGGDPSDKDNWEKVADQQ
jgi:hypothetical protein